MMDMYVNGESSARDPGRVAPHVHQAQRPSMEKLAADWSCPVELVEQLYVGELKVLERNARIQTFVPVVALRRVREALRDGSFKRRRAC